MNQPLYQQIINSIQADIMSGRLQPGDKVPSEKELTERYEVSRITAKKALDLLAEDEIISRIRGKGSYVNFPAESVPSSFVEERENLTEQSKKKLLIGAIFPSYNSGYGLQLQYAIERTVAEYGDFLIIKRSNNSLQEEASALASLLELGVSGMIVFPADSKEYNQNLLKLIIEDFPVVIVDRHLKGIQACTVHTDNKTAAFKLGSYLLEKGHEHIAFVSPDPSKTSTLEDRLLGFQQAFLASGARLRSDYLITNMQFADVDNENKMGTPRVYDTDFIYKFVQEHPVVTAFVATEYEIALLIYEALSKMKIRVPEDVTIVCFDCPDDPFDVPLFTHVRQYEDKMGSKAVHLLMSQLHLEEVPQLTLLGFEFRKGRST
ncbi:GntR family transcriptional regulator [Paenibacillus sp. Marseille-Q4541]|uniref:GntR family transcriptional regulator n=1 Tax=Paenibacillus sp. Marseille-Q4541 TaxID=2831522 RepID=UPI001BA6428C|nr:GntR family transcriptional regulator [Paenibacillus sp. Marseille-Q4541]